MLEHGNKKYTTYYNGVYTEVHTLDDCIRAVLCRNKNNEDRIKYLEEENKQLKDEAWKDEELQKMKTKYEKMESDYWRGFPITEKEANTISEWKKKHEEEVHGLTTDAKRLKAAGTIGGRYSYHFYPTSIGISGVVRCRCGAEFEFQEIG